MAVNRLEALFDALAHLRGWSNPDSLCYQHRNPIMIQSFSRPGKNEIDNDGNRVFASSLAGIRAGLFDLQVKLEGKSRAGLKPGDLLENLLRVLKITENLGQEHVVKFLRRALHDQSIKRTTPMSWFLEDSK